MLAQCQMSDFELKVLGSSAAVLFSKFCTDKYVFSKYQDLLRSDKFNYATEKKNEFMEGPVVRSNYVHEHVSFTDIS